MALSRHWRKATSWCGIGHLEFALETVGVGVVSNCALFWETNFDPVSYATLLKPKKGSDSVPKTVPECNSTQQLTSLGSGALESIRASTIAHQHCKKFVCVLKISFSVSQCSVIDLILSPVEIYNQVFRFAVLNYTLNTAMDKVRCDGHVMVEIPDTRKLMSRAR